MATLSAVGRARLGRHLMESIAGNDKAELVSDPSISHSLCVQRYEGICANSAAKGVIKNITCLLMSLSCESDLRDQINLLKGIYPHFLYTNFHADAFANSSHFVSQTLGAQEKHWPSANGPRNVFCENRLISFSITKIAGRYSLCVSTSAGRPEQQASFTGARSESSACTRLTSLLCSVMLVLYAQTEKGKARYYLITNTVQALNPAEENMHQNIHNLIAWEETNIGLQLGEALSCDIQVGKTRACPSSFMTEAKTCQHFITILLTLWDQGEGVWQQAESNFIIIISAMYP